MMQTWKLGNYLAVLGVIYLVFYTELHFGKWVWWGIMGAILASYAAKSIIDFKRKNHFQAIISMLFICVMVYVLFLVEP